VSSRRVVVVEYVSLDGVVQAPGHGEEDSDGGFPHGGWTGPFMADHRHYMQAVLCTAGAVLLGRRTYEIFAGYWPTVTDPGDEIARALNDLPRYVASTTLTDPRWAGTTVLTGDVAAAVAELKASPGKDLLVIGSSGLAGTLTRHDLVDEYQLWWHPVVLGGGKRLFPDGSPHRTMHLIDAISAASGLVICRYRAGP
jgi:dihydrofolate reductase